MKAQIFNAFDVSCTIKLNDFWECEFSILANNEANTLDILQEFNDVTIAQKVDKTEKNIWRWYIRIIKASWTKTEVECRTYEHLLERRKIATWQTYTQPLNSLLQWLLDDINTTYDTWITLDCSVTTNTYLVVQTWESFLSVLKNLTNTYEFKIVEKVLKVDTSVGTDRTVSWPDFFQFKREYNEPWDRNVKDFEVVRNADDLSNAIMWKSNNFSSDATSISKYWRVEDVITNSDWNESAEIADQLAERKNWTKKIELEPNVDNFFFAEVGDKVSILLNAWNAVWQSSGEAKIFEKVVDFKDVPEVWVKLSETKAYSQWLIETIRDTAKRVERLELQ